MSISIIIPTYNRNIEHSQQAVQSVLDQSSPNWHLIIAGDGEMPAVEAYSAVPGACTLLVFKAPHNSSAGLTRNIAASKASTEWIGFLDDDDILLADYVATWEREHIDTDILIFKMDNYGAILPRYNGINHGDVGINFAIRKDLFLELGGFVSERIHGNEDFIFLHKAKEHQARIKFSNYLAYVVRPYLKDNNVCN